MTKDELARTAIALEQCEGRVTQAASLLGISPQALKTRIRNHPQLKAYLKDVEPPSDEETLARPAPAIHLTRQEEEKALAIQKANEQVRKGFSAIGVTGKSLEQAMAFAAFGEHHFRDIRHYTTGGVAKLFADLMADIEDTRKSIDSTHVEDVELQRALREDRSRLVKLALDTYDRVREAALTQAAIAAKKEEAKTAKNKKTAGFAPLASHPPVAIQVNGGQVSLSAPAPTKDDESDKQQPVNPQPQEQG